MKDATFLWKISYSSYKAFFFSQNTNQIKGALKLEKNIHLAFWFAKNSNWQEKWLHHPLWNRTMKGLIQTHWVSPGLRDGPKSMEKRKQMEILDICAILFSKSSLHFLMKLLQLPGAHVHQKIGQCLFKMTCCKV